MIPTDADILGLLDRLEGETADDLETQFVEFKPWTGPKDDLGVAIEYAVCFANAEGGAIIFGIADRTRGRAAAIHGARSFDIDLWRREIYARTNPHVEIELSELRVPEGTGTLLVVRVPKGTSPPYGTSHGLFKYRVGKNCMPLDQGSFHRARVSSAAIDWSGEEARNVGIGDLDSLELARARAVLRSKNPESDLASVSDADFLNGLRAVRAGKVTHTGLVLFGTPAILANECPQDQVQYVFQTSDTAVSRNDFWRVGLLQAIDRIEQLFSGPANPEEELSVGLFKIRIPAFPLDAVRESLLNALTHRDYADPGHVLVRHSATEFAVTSPGGFIDGITPANILRHEPRARNRTLAGALVRLRLVESAGVGRFRIFEPALSLGKRQPEFSTDGSSVTLRLFNSGYDRAMATAAAKWREAGLDVTVDGLMVINHLRVHPFIDVETTMSALQVSTDEARRVLDYLSQPRVGILERRGHTRSATFHLTKGLAKELLGKAAYTRSRGINPARYAELVRQYLADNESLSNRELRELLGLGESASAQVEASQYLRAWSAPDGFLDAFGGGNQRRYRLRGRS